MGAEPQRQPWPRRWTVYFLRILEEINMSASGVGKKIIGMGDGSAGSQDGCTVKQMEDHVTAAIGDNVSKDPVHAATTAALPANTRTADVLKADAVGEFPTVDGVLPVINQEYLVKNEGGGASHINNGIYELTVLGDGATEWELTRRHDMEGGEGASGAMVPISDGTVNGDTTFKCINNIDSDTINTDALEFWFWGQTTDHANLKNVTSDQHHAQIHAPSHKDGGGDELSVEEFATGETDFQKVLRLDSLTAGALEFVDFPVKGIAQGISNNPPGAPTAKDVWLVSTVPTAAWVGHANELAVWDGVAWDFYSPTAGDTYWAVTPANYYYFTGAAWNLIGALISHTNLQDITANDHHARPIQATETVLGIAELATQPETDAGTDDLKTVTPLKLASYPGLGIPSGTSFPGTPSDGDLFNRTDLDMIFRYDATRVKWLSEHSEILSCGRRGDVNPLADVYCIVGGAAMSSANGFRMPRDGTIIAVTVQNLNFVTRTIDYRVNNSTVNRVQLALAAAVGGKVTNANQDFSADDLIQALALIAAGNTMSELIATVEVKWRAV